MAVCVCGLPARCCQPAVAVALFMQISGMSLALTWSPTGFVYSEFSYARAAAASFPLSKHTRGGDSAPAFSGQRVYLQLMWEVGLYPTWSTSSKPSGCQHLAEARGPSWFLRLT
jgi:hypothetical protein